MYSDKRRSRLPALLLGLTAALVLVLAVWAVWPRQDKLEAEEAIRDAIERTALQCYVVEGVYPPSLRYLEENYGLQINTRDYYVSYEAFSSNLAPTVRVIAR